MDFEFCWSNPRLLESLEFRTNPKYFGCKVEELESLRGFRAVVYSLGFRV